MPKARVAPAPAFPMYAEWKRLTRFYRSTLVALEQEEGRWGADEGGQGRVSHTDDGSKYEVLVSAHVGAVRDKQLLYSSVLILSCGLLEEHVTQCLTMRQANDPALIGRLAARLSVTGKDASDLSLLLEALFRRGGVEAWGDFLVAEQAIDYAEVVDGRAGLVEVFTLRNALAHGTAVVTKRMLNRVKAAGGTLPWPVNGIVSLTFAHVNRYRQRLQSFARFANGLAR